MEKMAETKREPCLGHITCPLLEVAAQPARGCRLSPSSAASCSRNLMLFPLV